MRNDYTGIYEAPRAPTGTAASLSQVVLATILGASKVTSAF